MKKKICLISYYYPFNRAPSLQNLVKDLASHYDISVLVDNRFRIGIGDDVVRYVKNKRTVVDAEVNNNRVQSHKQVFIALLPEWIKNMLINAIIFKNYFYPLISFVNEFFHYRKSDVVIVADKGSLFASLMMIKIPDIYYSLEVSPFKEEPNALFKFLHAIEYLYVKIFDPYVISQSYNRAMLLQKKTEKQVLIPVSSYGERLGKSDYLRRHFELRENQKIILLAGGLGDDQMTNEVVAQINKINSSYVIVLHSATGAFSKSLLTLIDSLPNKGRVLLTTERLSIDDSEKMIYAGADIGIVMYRDLGFNYRNTAYSSGKLASFLRAGVPVIVPNFQEFKEVINKYRFGMCSDVESLSETVDSIMLDYGNYVKSAYLAYDKIYRYSNYSGIMNNVIDLL